MALKLRTRGFRRINNPQPVLSQVFTHNQIVVEVTKKNWSKSSHFVGWVQAMVREGGQFVRLGRRQPIMFAKQTVRLDVAPVEKYQIQIILRSWLPYVNCQLWEVIPDDPAQ